MDSSGVASTCLSISQSFELRAVFAAAAQSVAHWQRGVLITDFKCCENRSFNFIKFIVEMCPCNADSMTVEHLLQHSQLHEASRRDMWPGSIPRWDRQFVISV